MANSAAPVVPKRSFGHTGVNVAKLCLGGGSFGSGDAGALLTEALRLGVDCWEIVSFTGDVYRTYFTNNPGAREKVFLSGKVYATDPAVMQEQLDKTLADNGTSYIDFLAIHQIPDIKVLNNEVRKWVEKVKKEKKIRFFGFCTHKNMAACLAGASSLGWIDGIQTAYNYRLQNIEGMQEALEKCQEQGIGLFAVKSMGLSVRKIGGGRALPSKAKLDAAPTSHDMTFEQAKLRAIWGHPSITSVCSLMPNTNILQANAAAALDDKPLAPEISNLLQDYAAETGNYYCRRCGVCDTTNPDKIPISGIMEMLMYARRYGLAEMVSRMFAQIPAEIQGKMESSDYSGAEKVCPQNMPLTQLMKEASRELRKD
ncbi:MAG: aldo/keto reductase [Deltaproteobacteria bacterium]|nr:aldo/keto reductase [Deltaproteobacteria bacterium]